MPVSTSQLASSITTAASLEWLCTITCIVMSCSASVDDTATSSCTHPDADSGASLRDVYADVSTSQRCVLLVDSPATLKFVIAS